MNVVTGAFGYVGRAIARRLLAAGEPVRTITTHPDRPSSFGDAVPAYRYSFSHPDALTATLEGAATLYNTYWIRFEHGGLTFDQAVRNTATLFACARRAGIRRIVHIGVTNAAVDSPLPYYRGKARQEEALGASGVSYAIVRPTLVFGEGDILVNNIAWLLRTFPVFPIFGSGEYRLQPVAVDDLARIAVTCGQQTEPMVLDAVGPEIVTFEAFVRLIARAVRPGVRLIHVPPAVGIALGQAIGFALRDVILTRAELAGLMANLLTSPQAPNGATRFTDWLVQHKATLGVRYASELGRHFRRRPA